MKTIRTLVASAAILASLAVAPLAAHAQDTTTPAATSTTATFVNSALVDTGRIGIGAIGILGRNESGSISRGLSFAKTDAVLTLDVFRYKTPIFGLKGETSLGVYLSTNDTNLKQGTFGPQVNYSLGRVFVGVAYVPNSENRGQFMIGRRF